MIDRGPQPHLQARARGFAGWLPALTNVESISSKTLSRWIWAFLIVGVMARSVRYFLKFPLWEDECFLVTHFAERGYAGLMQPLGYHQVAPLLFLWIELTLVKLLGFNEWAVRLFPFLCGLASLYLLRHLANRLLGGAALLVAVGIFSVAYPGIRYGAEAKPYGSDLFVSLLLLTMAVEWWRRPDRLWWGWGLAAFAPVAVGLSYPSVFVAGGASIVLSCVLFEFRRPGAWVPCVVYNVLLVASFAGFYFDIRLIKPNSIIGSTRSRNVFNLSAEIHSRFRVMTSVNEGCWQPIIWMCSNSLPNRRRRRNRQRVDGQARQGGYQAF